MHENERTSSVEYFSSFNACYGPQETGCSCRFIFGNVTFKNLNLKLFLSLSFCAMMLFTIDKAHSTLKTFFIVKAFFFAFLCSIDFSLSHDFNCICSSSSFSPLLQQSAILMQMTTFYFYSFDCECMEPDGENEYGIKDRE